MEEEDDDKRSGPGLSQDDVEELRAKLQLNLSWLATGTEDLLQDFKRQRAALKVQARKRREREREKSHHSHSHHHHPHRRGGDHGEQHPHDDEELMDHESGGSLHVSSLSHEGETGHVDPVGYHSEGALAATPSQGVTPRTDDGHYFSDEDWQTPFLAYSYTFRHSSRVLLSPDEKIRSDYMRASALKEDYLKRKRLQRQQQKKERERRSHISFALKNLDEERKTILQRSIQRKRRAAEDEERRRRMREKQAASEIGYLGGDESLGSESAQQEPVVVETTESGETEAAPGATSTTAGTDGGSQGKVEPEPVYRTMKFSSRQYCVTDVVKKTQRQAYRKMREERDRREAEEKKKEELKKWQVMRRRQQMLAVDLEAKKLLANSRRAPPEHIPRGLRSPPRHKKSGPNGASVETSDEQVLLVTRISQRLDTVKKRMEEDDRRRKEELGLEIKEGDEGIVMHTDTTVMSGKKKKDAKRGAGGDEGETNEDEPEQKEELSAFQKQALEYITEGSFLMKYPKGGNKHKSQRRYFKVVPEIGLLCWADRQNAKKFRQVGVLGVTPGLQLTPMALSRITDDTRDRSFSVRNTGTEGDINISALDAESFMLWMEGLDAMTSLASKRSEIGSSTHQLSREQRLGKSGDAPPPSVIDSVYSGGSGSLHELEESGQVLDDDARDRMLLDFLKEGSQMMKHTRGGRGKAHSRYFRVDFPSHYLRWSESKMSKKWRKAKVVGILRGIASRMGKSKDMITQDVEARAFTLKCEKGDDLYLVAPTVDICHRWMDGLDLVLEQGEGGGSSFADRAMHAVWGIGEPMQKEEEGSEGSGNTVGESVYDDGPAPNPMLAPPPQQGARSLRSGSVPVAGKQPVGGSPFMLPPSTEESDQIQEQAQVVQGQKLMKYTKSGKGKPHLRFFHVKMPEAILMWGDSKTSRRQRKGMILAVFAGSPGTAFPGVSSDVLNCMFTVRCMGKHGDVICAAPDVGTRDMWIRGVKSCKEKADRDGTRKAGFAYFAQRKRSKSFNSDDPTEFDDGGDVDYRKEILEMTEDDDGGSDGGGDGDGDGDGGDVGYDDDAMVDATDEEVPSSMGSEGSSQPSAQLTEEALKGSVEDIIPLLVEGEVLRKFTKGGEGKSHERFFFVDAHHPVIKWRDSKASAKNERRMIFEGVYETSELGFSILSSRSHQGLFLQAKTVESKKRWMRGLGYLASLGGGGSSIDGLSDNFSVMDGDESPRNAGIFASLQTKSFSRDDPQLTFDIVDDLPTCQRVAVEGCFFLLHNKRGRGKPQSKFIALELSEKSVTIRDNPSSKKSKKVVLTGFLPGIRSQMEKISPNVPSEEDDVLVGLTLQSFGIGDILLLEAENHFMQVAWRRALHEIFNVGEPFIKVEGEEGEASEEVGEAPATPPRALESPRRIIATDPASLVCAGLQMNVVMKKKATSKFVSFDREANQLIVRDSSKSKRATQFKVVSLERDTMDETTEKLCRQRLRLSAEDLHNTFVLIQVEEESESIVLVLADPGSRSTWYEGLSELVGVPNVDEEAIKTEEDVVSVDPRTEEGTHDQIDQDAVVETQDGHPPQSSSSPIEGEPVSEENEVSTVESGASRDNESKESEEVESPEAMQEEAGKTESDEHASQDIPAAQPPARPTPEMCASFLDDDWQAVEYWAGKKFVQKIAKFDRNSLVLEIKDSAKAKKSETVDVKDVTASMESFLAGSRGRKLKISDAEIETRGFSLNTVMTKGSHSIEMTMVFLAADQSSKHLWCFGIMDAFATAADAEKSAAANVDETHHEGEEGEERGEGGEGTDSGSVKPEAEGLSDETVQREDVVEEAVSPVEEAVMTPRSATAAKDEAVDHVKFGGRLHVWLKRKLEIRFVSAHAEEPGVLVLKDDVKSTKAMELHVKGVEHAIVGLHDDEYEMMVSQATRRLRSNVDQIVPISLTLQCDEEPQPIVLFCDDPADCDLWVLGLQTLADRAAQVVQSQEPQEPQESREHQDVQDAEDGAGEEDGHLETDSAVDYFDPTPFIPILRSGVPLQRFTNAGKGKLAVVFLRVFFNSENRVESIGLSDKANFKKETLVKPVSVLPNIDKVSGLQKKQDVFNAARDFGFSLMTTEKKADLHEMFFVTQRSEDHYNWVRTLHETL
eukprot:TRINITY_DN246_c0_g4_i1.p1 TRINITY_DN246_c0_g4~~TRINITY_DN246_c0_g4_i1.p1  ORF type:complete len:2128 (-),score=694.96 TRINITY_DN246_c0_g4_i1:293-6676(-)